MKIYTRTGDHGDTGLFGGGRVPKNHHRIEAYGTVDEANSLIGAARSQLYGQPGADIFEPLIQRIQEDLFVVGADLATPDLEHPSVLRIGTEHVRHLEAEIDRIDAELPPLKHFILPGGSSAASLLHVARTVCRRAERMAVQATRLEPVNEQVMVYLNRLSDLLFVLARWINQQAGIPDVLWKKH